MIYLDIILLQIKLLIEQMGLGTLQSRLFFGIQSHFVIPAVNKAWQEELDKILTRILKAQEPIILCGKFVFLLKTVQFCMCTTSAEKNNFEITT